MGELNTGSNRRFVAMIAAVITVFGNKKLGLDLDPTEVTELLIVLGGYIVASNSKEAIVERAKAAGKTAADTIVPGPETDAKLKDLAGGKVE